MYNRGVAAKEIRFDINCPHLFIEKKFIWVYICSVFQYPRPKIKIEEGETYA
jgi:hypothetical protein